MVVLVVLIPFLVIAGAFALVVISRMTKAANRRDAIALELQAQVTGDKGVPRGGLYGGRRARLGGREVLVQFQPGGRNNPPSLTLEMPVEVRFDGAKIDQGAYRGAARARVTGTLGVLFRRERGLDRFGKAIGLNVEHQTGDAEFDAAVYIESDAAKEDLDQVLSDPVTRRSIAAILRQGYSSVELFRGGDVLRAVQLRPTLEAARSVAQTTELLGRVADGLPAFEKSPVGRKMSVRAVIALAVGIGGGVASILFAVIATSAYKTIEPGVIGTCFLAGVCLWVLFSAITFVLARGKSDALRVFAIVLFSQLVGLPLLVLGSATCVNAAADSGPTTVHVAAVRRTWVTQQKNSKTYHVALESWRPDMREIETTVSSTFYADIRPGGRVQVETKPGALGWEWIDDMKRYRP